MPPGLLPKDRFGRLRRQMSYGRNLTVIREQKQQLVGAKVQRSDLQRGASRQERQESRQRRQQAASGWTILFELFPKYVFTNQRPEKHIRVHLRTRPPLRRVCPGLKFPYNVEATFLLTLHLISSRLA